MQPFLILIKNLSNKLSDDFGTGFLVANLRNCCQFDLTFPKNSYGFLMAEKEIWPHLRDIMRISDEDCKIFSATRKSADICVKIYDYFTNSGRVAERIGEKSIDL